MTISENVFNKIDLYKMINESLMAVLIMEKDALTGANPAFCDLTGYSDEELSGLSMKSFLSEESFKMVSAFKARIKENLKKLQVIRWEDKHLPVVMKHKDGKPVGVLMMLCLYEETEDKWVYQLIEQSVFHQDREWHDKMSLLKDYLLDISQSLIRLKDIQNFFSLVLEAASNTIGKADYSSILRLEDDVFVPVATRGYDWSTMKDFRLRISDSFSMLALGHQIDRTINIDDVEKLSANTDNFVEINGYKIRSALQTPIYLNGELYGLLSIDSSRKGAFTENDFNSIEYLRAQIQIALENQLLYNKIAHQAEHDELTDVVSRGAFEEQVVKFLGSRHHYESCCIIMMDLNDLKTVNDIWGHSSGDRMLLEFIRVMQKNLRGKDLLARLGGDEFAICFFSSQSAQFIERLEDIQQFFTDNPMYFDGRKVSCWFSYGISYCPEDGVTYDVLLNKADAEMYKMKSALKRMKLENDLHDLRQSP